MEYLIGVAICVCLTGFVIAFNGWHDWEDAIVKFLLFYVASALVYQLTIPIFPWFGKIINVPVIAWALYCAIIPPQTEADDNKDEIIFEG